MRFLMWYVVGYMCLFQAAAVIPNETKYGTLGYLVANPGPSFALCLFGLASFIILSYTIKYGLISVIRLTRNTREEAILSMILQIVFFLSGLVLLLMYSFWVTSIIMVIVFLHLLFSAESIRRA